MRIAAVQHDIVWHDPEATRAQLTPTIAAAAAGGARLIVLSEMYATGFSMDTDRIAEPEGGDNEAFLTARAAEHDAWLIASVAQRGADGLVRNNAIVAGPAGQLHRYAKIHPFSYADEHKHYTAGTEFLTVDIDGLRVTPFVCYDLRFADEFWATAAGTDVYVVPANWPTARVEHWRALLRARAIENQAFVVGVNRVGAAGRDRTLEHNGASAIIDPLGTVLVEALFQPAVLMADVTADRVSEVRREFPFLQDRRGR